MTDVETRPSTLDVVAVRAQDALRTAAESPVGRPVAQALRGDEWLGRPLHPYVVAVPTVAWLTAAYFDRRAARGDVAARARADRALRIGVAGAVVAAATGQAQFLDTAGVARRETTVHAALNNVALGLQVASLSARKRGRRGLGRALSLAAVSGLPISAAIGVDVASKLGKGFGIEAFRGGEPDAGAGSQR